MTNPTQNKNKIGKLLRFATESPVSSVYLGFGLMTFSIVCFGIFGHWWFLLAVPFGTVALAMGVAEMQAEISKSEMK